MGNRRQETVARIKRIRISAIIRAKDQGLARSAIQAVVAGGFRMVEFTLTTPGAYDLIKEFSKREDLLVGAGTVLTVEQARESVSAGACFLVSPIADPTMIAAAAELDVAVIPGAFTPAEMQAAHLAGADFVKVFPAPPGGISYIEAVLAPLPHLRLFPTAGFTVENFVDFLQAGCAGLGFVRNLFEPEDLAKRDFDAIRLRAGKIVRRFELWAKEHPSN